MGLLLDSWLLELLLVLAGALIGFYLWFLRSHSYWTRRGVTQLEPVFLFGNIKDIALGRRSTGEVIRDFYNQLKGHRFGGFYGFNAPMLLVRDTELIRTILVKDFGSFTDRGIVFSDEEPLNKHLFLLTGQKWRQLRVKMTPTFTTGKLKMMFPTMEKCGREMAAVLEERTQTEETVEMQELSARYTTDNIASVGFGIECNCQRDPDNEFRKWGRKVFEASFVTGVSIMLAFFNPSLSRFIKVKDGTSEVSQYFRNMVKDTLNYREKNNVSRKDFMQLLLQLRSKGFIEDDTSSKENFDNWKLSDDEAAAQAFVFFAAGFETSSTTISYTMHELSVNPDIQQKLQAEIDTVLEKNGGEVTYEAINEMNYLSMVVSETLRKYPPVPFLNRVTNEDYKLPGTDVILEKGTPVMVSVLGLHRDPEFFPDPERFLPERFSDANKAAIDQYAYLPFGEGPRICIGMRLGYLQSKVGLVHLLSKFSVRPSGKVNADVKFKAGTFLLSPVGGIPVKLHKRK